MPQALVSLSQTDPTSKSGIQTYAPRPSSANALREGAALWGPFLNNKCQLTRTNGEILSLMAIHLIVLAANRVNPELDGSVNIVSDFLVALDNVESLPPNRIPTRCKHSDILKNVMINCNDLTFDLHYSHVRAHQDDSTFAQQTSATQLHCRYQSKAGDLGT